MKTLLKFTLLSALIISGKLAKQPVQATVSPAAATKTTASGNSVVLVHQVLTSEPVQPAKQANQPSSGNGLLAELF
jgi:hypothetical protein